VIVTRLLTRIAWARSSRTVVTVLRDGRGDDTPSLVAMAIVNASLGDGMVLACDPLN
jgi:hypothetical protein